MGLFLTLLYIALSYLSPQELFPELAPYRIMLILALAATLVSVPVALRRAEMFHAPQSLLMVGMIFAVAFSWFVHAWMGGVLLSLQLFMPSAIVYFLVILHVNTWKQFRLLVFTLGITALALLIEALMAFYGGDRAFFMRQRVFTDVAVEVLPRLRSVGTLADPNDFAQYMLTMLPLFWLAWKKRKFLRNFALVLIPTGGLLYGCYMTHSRGATLGFVAMLLIAFRRRLGTVKSLLLGGVVLASLMALGVTGDRSISAGNDRLILWGEGLQKFKQSPLFGVGYNGFTQTTDLTAHNSFVLCLAELGSFGYFFWLGLILVALFQLHELRGETKANLSEPEPEADPPPWMPVARAPSRSLGTVSLMGGLEPAYATGHASSLVEVTHPVAVPDTVSALNGEDAPSEPDESTQNQERVKYWARTLTVSFTAFLVTCWFLSRTYEITVYLLVAMVAVLCRLSGREDNYFSVGPRNWVRLTLLGEVATVVFVYILVRLK